MFQTKFDGDAKLWSGLKVPHLYNSNINIAEILLSSMKMFGSKISQINDDSGIQLTFDELRIYTVRAAQNLRDRGYKPKQVIGIMAENVAHLTPIVFASFCVGCPVNALSVNIEKTDVIRMFGLTAPSVMFCDVKVYDLVKECLNELNNSAKIFTFNGTKGDSEAVESLFEETGSERDFLPAEVDGINDAVVILSTSGTSGPFKGLCLSHAALISTIFATGLCTSDDIIFCNTTIHWMSGYRNLLSGVFFGALRILTTEMCSPEQQLRMIEKYDVTCILYSLPNRLVSMLKTGLMPDINLSSVRQLRVGGTSAPLSMLQEFQSYMPNGRMIYVYGLTEMAGHVTVNINDVESSGQMVNGVSIKIINEEGERCGINTNGEICVKTPFKFLGYYGNPEQSARVIDSEGFFLTGDIGRIDNEGNLHIVERKKDLITYHIDLPPSDIEHLLTTLPGVHAVCVVGVPIDPYLELPAAVIVRENNSQITEEYVCQQVADNLADYYKLRGGVYFVESIPLTPSGKLLRRWAKEIASKLFAQRIENSTPNLEMKPIF